MHIDMHIKEIPFESIRPTGKTLELSQKPGQGWSAPIQFPARIYQFGGQVQHFSLSEYGAIRCVPHRPDKTAYRDGELPASLNDIKGGWIIVPWGEPQILMTCGTVVQMFVANGRVVIDFKTRSVYGRLIYQYQVHFPIKKPNEFEVHYYNCFSGHNTIVGAVAEPGNIANWRIKPEQPYMKKALWFKTRPKSQEAPDPDSIEPDPPFPPSPTPPEPEPEPSEWKNLFEGKDALNDYRVLRRTR